MLSALLVLALPLATPSTVAPPVGAAVAIDDKALRALDAWLRLYRAGKVDFTSKSPLGKDSIAVKFGITPKNTLGDATWAGDLMLILDAVAKIDDGDAALALLEVAAVGVDAGKYTFSMAPADVREAGEHAIARLGSAAAKERLVAAARGDLKTDKVPPAAWQAAAVRCLGLTKDRDLRPAVEALLADARETVRVNAAEALGNLGDEAAAPALIGALQREANDAALMTVVQALQTLFAKHVRRPALEGERKGEDAVPPPDLTLAVHAAASALGRTTWRADMAIVRLLDQFRSLDNVPALIAVLERFRDHPEEVKSGKLSGLLQYQVRELLVATTGAIFPADQPDKWRELWERERQTMKLAEKPPPRGPENTVAGGFCGIPVQGTRVVFVLDLSGSMNWPVVNKGTAGRDGKRGIEYAKEELERAMNSISPHAQFNLVTFNGDAKAVLWSKDMVVASDKNRERFLKYVSGLEAEGGTNLWAGLEAALEIKSLVYGARYASNVDEVFVLSDGAPSVGDVVDPTEILHLVNESNRFAKVRINTVFLANQPPRGQRMPPMPHMSITAEELMQRVAEQNGGKWKSL